MSIQVACKTAMLPLRRGPIEAGAPQAELRALFDKLRLEIAYQPGDQALDVAVTLYGGESSDNGSSAQVRAEDWLAPPVGFEPT
jgi:hypothetical protein